MNLRAVYRVDVGSIPKGNFGWACVTDAGDEHDGNDVEDLAERVSRDLGIGSVALGFECPLFVPLTAEPNQLLCCRAGEGARAWSASAGITTLGIGIVEAAWLLKSIRGRCDEKIPLFLNARSFRAAGKVLLLWEAFVGGSRKSTHREDAMLAVKDFRRKWPNIEGANALPCDGTEAISLAGLVALRTGWSEDIGLLQQKCIVIRPKID